ncbi:carbohydrate ABC transporter substrate-binding protein, partial [Streptomyces sp. NPDC056333]
MTMQSRILSPVTDPSRRTVVRGTLGVGAAALAAPLLTACGGGPSADPKTVTFGSNGADATPK